MAAAEKRTHVVTTGLPYVPAAELFLRSLTATVIPGAAGQSRPLF
jgi:hypothetical protein